VLEKPSDIVPADQLLPPHDSCPVCGGRSPRPEVAVLQVEPRVSLLQCTDCGAASASRFPRDAFLKELYSPEHYSSDLFSNPRPVERCAMHIARRIAFQPAETLRVLDYGGSDGALSVALGKALRALGHTSAQEFTVVELTPREPRGDVRFLTLEGFFAAQSSFDVVIASAVLEHLTNVPSVVHQLLSLAKPGALFYARTPYEQPLHRLYSGYRLRWPRHLHDMGPEFWSRFLKTFGASGSLLESGPSIVESDFFDRPWRTVGACVLKAPGQATRSPSGAGSADGKYSRGSEAVQPFSIGRRASLKALAKLCCAPSERFSD
jgi:SAM-dependent methyltransferase